MAGQSEKVSLLKVSETTEEGELGDEGARCLQKSGIKKIELQ